MMKVMVFQDQTSHRVGPFIYAIGHLRLVPFNEAGDEREQVQRLIAGDPTLGRYVGVADSPATRATRNNWRDTGQADPDETRNVGRRTAIAE